MGTSLSRGAPTLRGGSARSAGLAPSVHRHAVSYDRRRGHAAQPWPDGRDAGAERIFLVAYQSLYRKYRPQRFAELVGQDHVSTALRNSVRDGRVGHAYLFSGPRGTGKTTTARILAKALNCEHPTPEGEPDNTCESCLAITNGSSMDVMELDAASNNGVN